MTEKLYYQDAYLKEFYATVISAEKCGELYDVVLDKTAFFPEEGGQYSDRGTICESRVADVKEKDGIIHHYTETMPNVGARVLCKIDFDERYEKMQCHSGEHILSGIIHSLFGLDNVGFHLGAEDVTMDISAPLTREQLDRVELLANEVIYKNIEITSEFPSAEELPELEYRSKLELSENVRIIRIGEVDSCACCAPHVKYTGEIGVIKILDFAKLRGGIRIHIAAGRRAMRLYRDFYKKAQEISALLSVPKTDITVGVEKLMSDFAHVKAEYEEYRLASMNSAAEKLGDIEGNCVLVFPDASISELITFSNVAIRRVSGVLVLLSGCDGNYKYVISSKSCDLRSEVGGINKSLLGRGGGKPDMIQGSFASDIEQIREYFNPSRQG